MGHDCYLCIYDPNGHLVAYSQSLAHAEIVASIVGQGARVMAQPVGEPDLGWLVWLEPVTVVDYRHHIWMHQMFRLRRMREAA